ncbi:metal-dependent hydrolase [Selenomonas sp. oral taxon 138]|uniref:metal-dependent hydrolase n=1 Tax=Selenomonas sp. oral taxon 138 TaxID=712532 RepID=UPI0002A3B347|nr:metal-dependent hydrolase [Selenomonas sp. oral taxon 138]EKX94865.1 metallo-beta-lactamase domain protein [Selenomonas sp. oral taxon 138 str. F0429]
MVKFSYYGHAAFLLDDGTNRVLVDPFLTGNPTASIAANEAACDFILLTHAHGDHLGDAPSIAARTGAAIVAIPEVISVCEGQACAEIKSHPMNIGGSLDLPFGKVRMTFAQHSAGVAGGIACGFVIYIGGKIVYYSGDTALFSDMQLIGRKDAIDYAVLPIGDNYTMGLEDAAMAAQWLNASHVIPIHYDTWPIIAQEVNHYKEVTEAMTRARVNIVAPGETIEL